MSAYLSRLPPAAQAAFASHRRSVFLSSPSGADLEEGLANFARVHSYLDYSPAKFAQVFGADNVDAARAIVREIIIDLDDQAAREIMAIMDR